jgi:hypothetical protein
VIFPFTSSIGILQSQIQPGFFPGGFSAGLSAGCKLVRLLICAAGFFEDSRIGEIPKKSSAQSRSSGRDDQGNRGEGRDTEYRMAEIPKSLALLPMGFQPRKQDVDHPVFSVRVKAIALLRRAGVIWVCPVGAAREA